jgi:methylated-DNA-protein-cysteine methyltransferase-like protein
VTTGPVSPSAGFHEAVSAVIAATAPGEVVTYGEVAAEAGFPGAARAVGSLLFHHGEGLPWWRVVTATGRLVPGHEREHARRLRAEGVTVRDGRVRDGRVRVTPGRAGRAGSPAPRRG